VGERYITRNDLLLWLSRIDRMGTRRGWLSAFVLGTGSVEELCERRCAGRHWSVNALHTTFG
jgi:hypothetical protein